MSLSHDTVLELMSLADGELEGDDKARVERLVASSDEARRVLEAMQRAEVGAWLSESQHARAGQAGADGIADAVMAAVEGSAQGRSVAPRAPRATSSASLQSGGVVSIAGVRTRKSSRVQFAVSAAVAGLALAAAVALYVRAGGERTTDHAPVASVGIPPVDFQVPSASVAQVEPAGGVEINEIDAPSRGVSVFEIPVGAAAAVANPTGASSVVVWVDDDPGSK
jgi:anti-sigma factor RsiW